MGRIRYFDGMRALAIFFVVYAHVIYISYGEEGIHMPSIHGVFINFYMQLFFFISGFFVFKETPLKTMSQCLSLIKKRFVQLIIPPLFWGFLYAYITNRGIYDMLLIDSHSGYWYTLVLFIFTLMYTCFAFLEERRRLVTMVCVAFIIYAISIYSQHHYFDNAFLSFFSVQRWHYIVYFVEGIMLRYFYTSFKKYALGMYLPTISILLLFCFIFFQEEFYKRLEGFPLSGSVIQLSYTTFSILAIWIYAYRYNDFFESHNFFAKSISKVGRRTMDIYMIHFFFIPINLAPIAHNIAETQSVMVDLVVTSPIVVVIIAMSYFVGSVLRLSKPLAHYFLSEE